MRKKIVFLLFALFFSQSLWADLGKKIQDLNETIKSVGNPLQDCTACTVAAAGQGADDGQMVKSCVDTICSGKDFSLSKILSDFVQKSASPDPVYDKELAPIVNEIAKHDANDKIDRANKITEYIKNPPALSDKGGIRVYNLFSSLNSFSKFKFKAENGKVVIDREQSKLAFPNMSAEDFDRQAQIASHVLDAFVDRSIPETDPARVQLYYPGDQFKNRVNEVIGGFQKKKDLIISDPELSFLTDLEEFKEMTSGERLKNQFATSASINPDLITDLNQTNSVLNLFVAMAKDPALKKLLDTPPIDIKKAVADRNVEALLKDRVAKQQTVLAMANLNAAAPKCKAAFSLAQQVLPTQKELDGFKQRATAIKSQFLNNAKK